MHVSATSAETSLARQLFRFPAFYRHLVWNKSEARTNQIMKIDCSCNNGDCYGATFGSESDKSDVPWCWCSVLWIKWIPRVPIQWNTQWISLEIVERVMFRGAYVWPRIRMCAISTVYCRRLPKISPDVLFHCFYDLGKVSQDNKINCTCISKVDRNLVKQLHAQLWFHGKMDKLQCSDKTYKLMLFLNEIWSNSILKCICITVILTPSCSHSDF